jgi:signal transduction histidine kinase
MDDAVAPSPWDALLALVTRLGPYDEVTLERDVSEIAAADGAGQTIDIPDAGGRPVARLRLVGGAPLPGLVAAGIRDLARGLLEQEQDNALLHLLGRHVVHDLRTPVTIIQGYGDLLRSGKLPLAAGTAPLQAIVDQTARLLAILYDFALASGTQVPGRRLCTGADLSTALQGMADARVAAGLPPVAVEAGLLGDIVKRLLAVARAMSGPAAALVVSALPADGAVLLTVTAAEPLPLLAVAQAALAGVPPTGPHARLPWLMGLLALQRLVMSQGGDLAIQAAGGGPVWQCRLPSVEAVCPTAGDDG